MGAGPIRSDPEHMVVTEPVPGSECPVHLMYVELLDGVYAPIGLRYPTGAGPHPLVLFAMGNGGGGMAVVREFTRNGSWTQEQFLAAGYAVAWLRYRAEVDYAYDRIGKLVQDIRQRRQLVSQIRRVFRISGALQDGRRSGRIDVHEERLAWFVREPAAQRPVALFAVVHRDSRE